MSKPCLTLQLTSPLYQPEWQHLPSLSLSLCDWFHIRLVRPLVPSSSALFPDLNPSAQHLTSTHYVVASVSVEFFLSFKLKNSLFPILPIFLSLLFPVLPVSPSLQRVHLEPRRFDLGPAVGSQLASEDLKALTGVTSEGGHKVLMGTVSHSVGDKRHQVLPSCCTQVGGVVVLTGFDNLQVGVG